MIKFNDISGKIPKTFPRTQFEIFVKENSICFFFSIFKPKSIWHRFLSYPVQSDWGSEFVGPVQGKQTSWFVKVIEQAVYQTKYQLIPVVMPQFNGNLPKAIARGKKGMTPYACMKQKLPDMPPATIFLPINHPG